MDNKSIHSIELEDTEGHTFARFNTYQEYADYMYDLAVEAYDSISEVSEADLFNFKTWVVVFDNNGDLRSLTMEQFTKRGHKHV